MKLQNRHIILMLSALLASFYPVYRKFSDSNPEVYIALFWVIILLMLLGIGNRQIAQYLDDKYPWNTYKAKRLSIQMIVVLFYSLICVNLTYLFIRIGLTEYVPSFYQLIAVNVLGIVVSLPAVSIYYAAHFLKKWQTAQVRNEELCQERLQKQLETLQNYIDPVFSLRNAEKLAELTETDPKQASFFLEKFIEVYGYVVEHRHQHPVRLRDELNLVDAYFHLLKTRLGDAFVLDINLSDEWLDTKFLPPLVIQLLIENALKHNELQENKPLHIEIFSEHDKSLVIRNNIQRRPKPDYSPRSILAGIRSRYALVSQREIFIEVSDVYFTVNLPLLDMAGN